MIHKFWPLFWTFGLELNTGFSWYWRHFTIWDTSCSFDTMDDHPGFYFNVSLLFFRFELHFFSTEHDVEGLEDVKERSPDPLFILLNPNEEQAILDAIEFADPSLVNTKSAHAVRDRILGSRVVTEAVAAIE